MRVLNKPEEDFVNVFPPQKVAAVKVKCLLQAAIDDIFKIHKPNIVPYSASLNLISDLFDSGFNSKAYEAIRDFDYRLSREEHPCGEKIEDYLHQMTQTIDKAHLLAATDS